MKIGCHAVLFKEKIKTDTEKLIMQLSKIGYNGSEIGARFFGTEDKMYLEQVMEENHYELSAMHVAGELNYWTNEDLCKEQNEAILKAAEFVRNTKNPNLVLSGIHNEEINDFESMACGINLLAKACKKLGVQIHYHNHSWEFENGARIFKALEKNAPDIFFGFDLGWAQKSGYDPFDLIKQHRDRINYVHLRDLSEEGEFVEIGEGIVNFSRLIDELEKILNEDGWIIIEYENGTEDVERYAKAYKYLNSLPSIGKELV